MRPGFIEWMQKINNIYYANDEKMSNALTALQENEKV